MKKYRAIIFGIFICCFSSCEDFLNREPDSFIATGDVFKDPNMIQAVVANLYGRVNWGQNISDDKLYIYLDEACLSNGSPDLTSGFSDTWMRVYDYALIRNINEFMEGLRSPDADNLDPVQRRQLEGEVRFLRAWTYFNMCRCMGGMPIVGDEVFEYKEGMDITPLQLPRSTESEMYDYIISECTDIASNFLTETPSINNARVTKWAALALKARAALYAASIAKYNNLMPSPIQTNGGEVGIPASMANAYYVTALTTAREIISGNKYQLYNQNPDKRRNFYEATTIKDNNHEVIWTIDHVYPGNSTLFSCNNVPTSAAEDESSTNITPILNLVEAFEYIDDRDGTLKTTDDEGNYIIYENSEDLFANKDPRLWGTIIFPGADFKGQQVIFQAGRKVHEGSAFNNEIAIAGTTDNQGNIITSINGPIVTNDGQRNKSGFCIRKFIDEDPKASTRQGSDVWFIIFRYSEVLMIAAEAALETNDATALNYINEIRERAGISTLSAVTIDDILRERRVEFAFENHRYWDLKRLRKAHIIWNGVNNDTYDPNNTSTHYALFPYRINNPGGPDDGKWVFDKQKVHMTPYPRFFEMRNYYNFIDQSWLSNNPKLVKNPYQ